MKRLTPIDGAAILIAFERGDDLASIAEQAGVTRYLVTKHLKSEGYKQKRKGRTSFACIARAREMSERGWPAHEISRLLRVDIEQVEGWLRLPSDPIRKSGRDSIWVRGKPLKRYKPSRVSNPRKAKWKPPSKEVVKEKDLPYINLRKPPPPHKKGKWWSIEEEAYVLELMKTGEYTIRQVYEKSRASRRQQLRIWRKYRGKKSFPPAWPEVTPDEARAIWEAKQAGDTEQADEILRATEERAVARQKKIADLEAQAIEEEQKIKQLEEKQRKLAAERAALERRVEKLGKSTKKTKRKVLPGSYEAEVLGLKPGSAVEPGKPGRPALHPKVEHLGEYADNGRYFAVSKDWADLDEATPDELALFADYLTSKGFPSKVERSGDQPKAYFDSTWPKKVETKWNRSVDGGLSLLEKYQARKEQLRPKKMFSKGIANYLAKAYTAYVDPSLTQSQKSAAKEEVLDDWARLKKVDRLILIFNMRVSKPNGEPTTKGIERGRAAKILLEKEARAAAKKLEARQLATQQRKSLRQAEQDEVDAILSGGMLALGEGDE